MIYKAQSKEDMAKVSTTLDAVDIQRAKWAQQLTNKASSAAVTHWMSCFTWILVFSDNLIMLSLFLYSTCTQIWLLRKELISLQNLKLHT